MDIQKQRQVRESHLRIEETSSLWFSHTRHSICDTLGEILKGRIRAIRKRRSISASASPRE